MPGKGSRKRYRQEKTCQRKIKYRTKTEACEFAGYMWRRYKRIQYVYLCPVSNHYHLTDLHPDLQPKKGVNMKWNTLRKDKKLEKKIVARLLEVAMFRRLPHNDLNIIHYGVKKIIEEVPVMLGETAITTQITVQLDTPLFDKDQRYSYLQTYLLYPNKGYDYTDIQNVITLK